MPASSRPIPARWRWARWRQAAEQYPSGGPPGIELTPAYDAEQVPLSSAANVLRLSVTFVRPVDGRLTTTEEDIVALRTAFGGPAGTLIGNAVAVASHRRNTAVHPAPKAMSGLSGPDRRIKHGGALGAGDRDLALELGMGGGVGQKPSSASVPTAANLSVLMRALTRKPFRRERASLFPSSGRGSARAR